MSDAAEDQGGGDGKRSGDHDEQSGLVPRARAADRQGDADERGRRNQNATGSRRPAADGERECPDEVEQAGQCFPWVSPVEEGVSPSSTDITSSAIATCGRRPNSCAG